MIKIITQHVGSLYSIFSLSEFLISATENHIRQDRHAYHTPHFQQKSKGYKIVLCCKDFIKSVFSMALWSALAPQVVAKKKKKKSLTMAPLFSPARVLAIQRFQTI